MLNMPAKPRKLSSRLFERLARKTQLDGMSALQITGLILDYELILTEDCDPVEVILALEFGTCHPENRTADWSHNF